jgi:hypothetical protein
VPRPLLLYLLGSYARYYFSICIVWFIICGPMLRYGVGNAALLPLSFVASLALSAIVVQCGSKREFETMESLGQSPAGIAMALALPTLVSQAAVCMLAVSLSNNAYTWACAASSMLSVLVGDCVTLGITWQRRDTGAVMASVLGPMVQVSVLAASLAFILSRHQ